MRSILPFSFLFALMLSGAASAGQLTVHTPSAYTESGSSVDRLLARDEDQAALYPLGTVEALDLEGDELDAFNRLWLERGWGDGLPLIPPTPERVAAMVEGYDLPGDMPIAVLDPMGGVATVENIAVNAVMAGCEPMHMPLLVAAVEAVSQPEFDLRGMSTTTNPDAVLVIASGPIVRQMGLNAGTGTFGRGNRANASISRALHLIIQNIGGSRPGSTDMSTLGQPGEFVMFLAENEAASPWPPFHTEDGFLPGRSVVTVAAVEGHSGIVGIGYSRPEYLQLVANLIKGQDRAKRREFFLLVAQDTAQMLAREGWDRESMRRFIREKARIPFKEWIALYHSRKARNEVPPEVFETEDPDALIPKPYFETMRIIVAGGTGEKSMVLPCWSAGRTVSQEVRIPYKWQEAWK